MANVCYDLREIILGLRGEYRKNAQELSELKEYIMVMNQHIKDFEFLMTKEGHEADTVKLFYRFVEQRNKLQERRDTLARKLGWDVNRENIVPIEKNADQNYEMNRNSHTTVRDQEAFKEQVEKVRNSEFVEQMPGLLYTSKGENTENIVDLDISSLSFSQMKNGECVLGIVYDAASDTLRYKNSQWRRTEEDNESEMSLMDALYEVKYPRDHFSEYQQQLIEQSEASKQNIELEVEHGEGTYTFKEQPGEKTVVLSKAKKR